TFQLIAYVTNYQLVMRIENMTAATVVENWTVTFTFPAEQTLQYSFSSTFSRSGAVGTLAPMAFNARIGPGGTATFGLLAARPAGSPDPSGFRFNSSAGTFTCTPWLP